MLISRRRLVLVLVILVMVLGISYLGTGTNKTSNGVSNVAPCSSGEIGPLVQVQVRYYDGLLLRGFQIPFKGRYACELEGALLLSGLVMRASDGGRPLGLMFAKDATGVRVPNQIIGKNHRVEVWMLTALRFNRSAPPQKPKPCFLKVVFGSGTREAVGDILPWECQVRYMDVWNEVFSWSGPSVYSSKPPASLIKRAQLIATEERHRTTS